MGGRFRARQNSGHLFVGSPRTPSSLVPRSATRPLFHRIIPFAGQPRENGDTRIDNLERDSVSFGSLPFSIHFTIGAPWHITPGMLLRSMA